MLVGAGDIANCELLPAGRAGYGASPRSNTGDGVHGGDHAPTQLAPQSSIVIATNRRGADIRRGLGPRPAITTTLPAKRRGISDYFGESAGPDRRGYYSYEAGAWHVVS